MTVVHRFDCTLYSTTAKLGYNELGYNEHSVITVITNKKIYLVGLGHFHDEIARL